MENGEWRMENGEWKMENLGFEFLGFDGGDRKLIIDLSNSQFPILNSQLRTGVCPVGLGKFL
jgi:hypothetical protein